MIDPEAPDFERLTALSQARTVRDMKTLAAANGVRIPSYLKTSSQIRDYLARELSYNPGEDFDAYAARFPGASVESPTDVAAKLSTATSRDEARELLQGKTSAELREIAKAAGVPVPSRATKERLVEDLVFATVGQRLTSAALSRVRQARNS